MGSPASWQIQRFLKLSKAGPARLDWLDRGDRLAYPETSKLTWKKALRNISKSHCGTCLRILAFHVGAMGVKVHSDSSFELQMLRSYAAPSVQAKLKLQGMPS
jgi:hypothetical protein